jgi:hypothetical protein
VQIRGDPGKEIMNRQLTIYAGQTALRHIRDKGLSPEDVSVIVGAAGGPKWLVLNHLDRMIFSSWLNNRKKPLYLLGSSIGSWRFAAVSQKDPMAAMDRFQYAYIRQAYQTRPGPGEVSRIISRILDDFLNDNGIREILAHPFLRLNIMAVNCRHMMASDHKAILGIGLAGAALMNMIRRDFLKFFFRRALFYHPGEKPPFFHMRGFPIEKTILTEQNLRKALLASGSIPLVMEGVTDIPGRSPGMYRDGGILDYHFDIDFSDQNSGLVLYPHYTDRIIPGWLDKKPGFRKPLPGNMENVILLAPSREFINRLPCHKIPDRNDFFLFKGQDRARISYWLSVINESRRLSDAFGDAVESGRIRELAKPMPF